MSQGMMIPVRAVFEKRGRSKYISHLDMNRCVQRACSRASLPVWYTEGFHPHAYLTFALALSLGYESSCEVLDFRLTEPIPMDEVAARLNQGLPEGMHIVSCAPPVRKQTEITAAEYAVTLRSHDPEALCTAFQQFLEQPALLTEKKTKHKGIQQVDLKPQILALEHRTIPEGLFLQLRLPAGTQNNLNPSLLLNLFLQQTQDAKLGTVERTAILCGDGERFH